MSNKLRGIFYLSIINQQLMKKTDKSDLPEKICPVCGRPFAWRKRWEKNWETVKYCSERCRRNKSVTPPAP